MTRAENVGVGGWRIIVTIDPDDDFTNGVTAEDAVQTVAERVCGVLRDEGFDPEDCLEVEQQETRWVPWQKAART